MAVDDVSQGTAGKLLGRETQRLSDSRVAQQAPRLTELRSRKVNRVRDRLRLVPRVAHGVSLLDLEDDRSAAALGCLHTELSASYGSRVPSLEAWRESHPEWRSWVLGVLDDAGGLRAVAPLALRQRVGLVRIRFIGDQCPLVFRSDGDALDLAKALASALRNLHRPWSMDLHQLPSGSAFTDSLSRQLKVVEIHPGADCPLVLVDGIRDPREILSRNLRAAEAKARNRIKRDGLVLETRWIAEPWAIAERMPEVLSVHRARDLQLRGASPLDDPQYKAYYAAHVRRHLDQLELLEIRLDGELSAYLLWLRDGATRVVLDNRVAPCWTSHSAGLIANNMALRQAATDPLVEVLDWGPGPQRYKLQSANKVLAHERLLAWSSRSLRRAGTARRMVARRRNRGSSPVPHKNSPGG